MKDIPGYEGRYAVTEDGQVWSHPKRYGVSSSREHAGMWMRSASSSKGYLQVSLVSTDGRRLSKRLHRLVALTFIPNPNGLPEVNHKNGDKADNRVSNLEWCTTSHNARHALASGLRDPNTPAQVEARRRNQKLAVAGWRRARAALKAQP